MPTSSTKESLVDQIQKGVGDAGEDIILIDLNEIDIETLETNELEIIKNTTLILKGVENYKQDINREAHLRDIYKKIVSSVETDEEGKIIAVVNFVQFQMAPPSFPPIDADKQAITDPLVLLELGLGGCGQTNRLLVDILNANGHTANVLQLNGHVAAAVLLKQSWRFLDADALSLGLQIRNLDNELITIEEILENPALTHNVQLYSEVTALRASTTGELENTIANTYGSLKTFEAKKYGDIKTPYFIVKEDVPDFSLTGQYYGWEYSGSVAYSTP